MIRCPRLLIGGAHSGVGKTSVTLALVHALKRRGLKVRAFKVGPDFLDPTYLKLASGHDCYNLDGWMMGQEYVKTIFEQTTAGYDIAIIEGVMGLFDSSSPDSLDGSSAQIAQWLQAPVALVANAGGVARSFAALATGFDNFEQDVNISGVIANHCGSKNHADLLAQVLSMNNAPPLMGGILKGAFPKLEKRHLGLVTANSEMLDEHALGQLADAIEQSVNLEKLISMAKSAPSIPSGEYERTEPCNSIKGRLGIAYDRLFHFYYPDNLHALEDQGIEIVRFSPLNDDQLPEGLDAAYFGGGYPETMPEELAMNRGMIDSINGFYKSGRPIYAECGGLIYMSQGVEDLEGRRHPFAGVLPSWCKMSDKFSSLGYVEAELKNDSLFGQRGVKLRGHKFHYSFLLDAPESDPDWDTVYTLTRPRTGKTQVEGYQKGSALISYAHLHFASKPGAAEWFAGKCIETRKS